MRATMLLADFVQVADGKLQIIGGGWSVTGPEPTTCGLAVLIHVPWSQANARHVWEVVLEDGDGHPVEVPHPSGEPHELRFRQEFEVGRPAGVPPGSLLECPYALNLMALPLQPSARYVWRLRIDGHEDENWQVAFSTRPAKLPLSG